MKPRKVKSQGEYTGSSICLQGGMIHYSIKHLLTGYEGNMHLVRPEMTR